MATKHTTNYQLNLWEPNDSFLRTEFNENSSKIDAALAALQNQVARVKLLEYVSSTTAAELVVDVSKIDWDAWRYVEVFSDMVCTQPSISVTSEVRVNGITNYLINSQYSANYLASLFDFAQTSDSGIYSCDSTLTLRKTPAGVFHAHSYTTMFYKLTGSTSKTYPVDQSTACYLDGQPVKTLSWTAKNTAYAPGSKIVLWGVK